MNRKWKEYCQPKKLTDFFTQPKIQDGTRGPECGTSAAYTDLPDADDTKIYAKLIATRLVNIMSSLIHPDQSGSQKVGKRLMQPVESLI